VLQGTVRKPRTALIAALSGLAAILAILIVVVIVVQRQDNDTTASVPLRTLPGASLASEVDVTIAAVADGVVPNVVGAAAADARAALESDGYMVVTEPHCFDQVSGQIPAGGADLDDGGRVELLFEPCVVPDFVGLRLAAAISIVENEFVTGLLISWPEHCEDVILGQSIPPGTTVEPGTEVRLTMRTNCG
jgi:beta-lactam-binding protein with PASTA domain